MDKNLTIKDHLAKTYKKVLSRTRLLAFIRHYISPWVAEMIYKVRILPSMLYCSNIMLGISNTHKSKFERIRSRVLAFINGNRQRVKLLTVSHARNKKCLFKMLNAKLDLHWDCSKDMSRKFNIKKRRVEAISTVASKSWHRSWPQILPLSRIKKCITNCLMRWKENSQ